MKFNNQFIQLGDAFYQRNTPTPVENPALLIWNSRLADELDMSPSLQADTEQLAQHLAGNQMFDGAEPVSAAYAGHQFGNFNPQLGDGRAHLLGELEDREGQLRDLQLKGSGTSAFSRGGDGRCALKPALREFIMSEAMYALGVPTTQCLAVTQTGEPVLRQGPEPGAVVTRVASSHIRVGSFQFFALQEDTESLQKLQDFCIERHFPELNKFEGNRTLLFLEKVIDRQIHLICQWLRVGFIHGVMNTDNTAISGETIDYGPCAMLGTYNPKAVFSSIDHQGRYAFGKQATLAHWNMARFAESLLPLLNVSDKESETFKDTNLDKALLEQAQALIEGFTDKFEIAFTNMMCNKLGLLEPTADDPQLIQQLLETLAEKQLDYTLTFDKLTNSLTNEALASDLKSTLGAPFDLWLQRIEAQAEPTSHIQTSMRKANPVVIPRNHHVEAVLQECEDSGTADAALAFLEVLRTPYEETEHTLKYQDSGDSFDQRYQTFCGT